MTHQNENPAATDQVGRGETAREENDCITTVTQIAPRVKSGPIVLTFFAGDQACVVPHSSETFRGLDELEAALRDAAKGAPGATKSSRGFFIPCTLRGSAEHPGGYRNGEHVEAVHAVAIDYDGTPEVEPDWRRTSWPCRVLAYSSHNYDPVTAPGKWRVILGFSRPTTREEYDALRRALQAKVPAGCIIRSAVQPAYLPTCPLGREVQFHNVVAANGRETLDVDALLAEADAIVAAAAPAAAPVAVERTAGDPPAGVITEWAPKVAAALQGGSKERAAFALAGVFARAGVGPAWARGFVRAVLSRRPDVVDLEHGVRQVERAYERHAAGDQACGWPALVAALDPEVADELARGLEAAIEDPAAVADRQSIADATRQFQADAAEAANDVTQPIPDPLSSPSLEAVYERRDWWMRRFNAQHTILQNEGGHCLVTWDDTSEVDGRAKVVVFQSPGQFRAAHGNIRDALIVKKPPDEDSGLPEVGYVKVADWWLEQRERAQARKTVFRPAVDERFVDGCLNLWTGFAVEPRVPGAAARRFLRFVTEVVASGNHEHARYIRRWIAWTFQNRGERAGVALVLRGAKGVGKNTLLDAVRDIWGGHGLTVTRPEHVTGKFNAHQIGKCFLFANEAIPPADKAAESALKGMITDPSIAIERKGIDVTISANCLNVAVSSNESWAVPATPGERRFAVFDVSSCRKGDVGYWNAVHGSAADREALLGELLGWALSVRLPRGWHPRWHVPQTEALGDQIFRGLRGEARAVGNMLWSGEAIGDQVVHEADGVFIATRGFLAALGKSLDFETVYGRELAKCCHSGSRRGRPQRNGIRYGRGYWLPSLEEARARWAAASGFTSEVSWPHVGGWLGSDDDGAE